MTTPDYQLSFEDRGDYLFAHLTGGDSFAASLEYWNNIADKIAELGYRKLLVHENLTGHLSIRQMYDLIMDLKNSVLKEVKIAVYDENPDDSFVNRLGRLVANYRGGNVHLFNRMDKALKWIEQSP